MKTSSLRAKIAVSLGLCGIILGASAAPKKILVVTVTTRLEFQMKAAGVIQE